mmetsp:Transcript_29049/g.36005  ORF Transcript_29049/g.36005 Transcript_29049/m.36005 type:complete len:240 (+) Transcript_29049:1178-1897(+)
MINCRTVFDDVIEALIFKALPLKEEDPARYTKAIEVILSIQLWLNEKDVTFCNFSLDIESVLKDSQFYYLDPYKDIKKNIMGPAEELSDAVTLHANVRIDAPLYEQFANTSLIQDFLNAFLIAVVIYLTILASLLVLSLMLADVDGKTYEYGMLRSLGFMKRHLVAMITFNSLTFSIPGLTIGICVAYVLNAAIREVIFLEASNWLSYDLSMVALTLGIICGFLVPLLANYLPIKTAMD